MSRQQVNARIDERETKIIEQIMADRNISRSEAVRTAIVGYEEKQTKADGLSYEERKMILEWLGYSLTNISAIERAINGMGNNVNQIAKATHQGKSSNCTDIVERFDNFMPDALKFLKQNEKAMDDIWRTLQ